MKILVVDGHAYAYRAFYAIRNLRSPEGKPTNAIYGFIKMLEKMRAAVSPTHVVVVWDGGLSAERQRLLAGYKTQRPAMPDELAVQLDEIGEYLRAVKITSYCEDGVEADDYIAFIAQSAAKADMEVVIASADKDFMQLVGPGIGLLNPNDKSGVVWQAEQVRAKTGVEPRQVVDWLSLVGDSVDNIPGVPGVGSKTATELLNQFGSVDEIYSRLNELKSERIQRALSSAEADVRRNQSLIALKINNEWRFSREDLVVRLGNSEQLMNLFRNWGFRSMLAELRALDIKDGRVLASRSNDQQELNW